MRLVKVALLASFLLAAAPAFAAESGPAKAALGTDRLFLSFVEDTALASKQWWEGQLDFADGNPVDATVLRGVVALQPKKNLEVGGRIGFGGTDGPPGFQDGRGATDLDLWAKWNFGTADPRTGFVLGGLVTIPTGDDSVGLGTDSFGLEFFGAMSHELKQGLRLAGNLGVRLNEDGRIFGYEINGKISASLGVGVVWPVNRAISVVGEGRVESKRFEGADTDARLLGGVNWTVARRSNLRGAVAIGLTDGAPDVQLIAGYVYAF